MTADRLHQEALDAQFLAEHARSDYGRLRQEYRERYRGRIPQWAADIRFKGLSVAQECLVDDTWYSRQASEKSAAANACYATVVALMEDVSSFLRQRTARMLTVPTQREG